MELQPRCCQPMGERMAGHRPNSLAKHIICSASGKLYQVQKNGSVWAYDGSPYWWRQLTPADNGMKELVAGGTNESYRLRNDGKILKLTGDDNWELISNNLQTNSIYVAGTGLYQILKDQSILKCVGTSAGLTFWQALDSTQDTSKFVASENGTVWQLLKNGDISASCVVQDYRGGSKYYGSLLCAS